MLNFIEKMLKLDKVGDGGAGGPPKDPPKPSDQPPAPKDAPPPKADGHLDDLGYTKAAPEDPPPGDKKPEGDLKKEDPPKAPEKVENPATGYGDKEPVVEDPPPADPPKDPPPPATDLDKQLEGLNKSFAEQVKKQITDLGLEGEARTKYIALKHQEQKDAIDWGKNQAAREKQEDQVRRQSWHKELKEDPAFGGDKFSVNITRSEKILDEYLPELKKELTDAKQILRPSVMRGLARLADQLYPDRKMVQGDPPAADDKGADKDKPIDPLAFYQ